MMIAAYGVGPEFVLIHDNTSQGSCSAHYQKCLERTVHSRDGMASMCGIGLIEVFVGVLFHLYLSKISNRLLLKKGT
jgi:hypothetical protein